MGRFGVAAACASVIAALFLVPAPALAGFDAGDTCATAMPIAVGPAWTYEALATDGDRDWYSFTLATDGWALITLGGLPDDYRLTLYGACGKALATSDRSGTQYEELYRSLSAGTYNLRVDGNGHFGPGTYGIRVRTPANGVHVLSSSGWLEYGVNARIAGEVLNNSSSAREDVKIRIRFYDDSDTLIATRHTWARRERMPGHSRSMFLWADEPIAGFDHYTAQVVRAPVASYPPLTGLVIHPGGSVPDGFGGLDYVGTLENTRGFPVGIPRVMLTVYDRWGEVRNAGFNDTDPDPLAAHSSNSYDVYLSDRNTGNRRVFTAHGYAQ